MKFDIHYLFSGKHAQWISIALVCLFSLLIIIECSHLRFSPPSSHSLPKTDKDLLVFSKEKSVDALLHSSIFGVYVSNNLDENSVKKSMLNVTLVGILFANTMDDSQVIIRSSSGEERMYRIGDKIPGGALIKRIMSGGVLVERQGNLESLSLPKNELIFEPVAKPLKGE